MRAVPCYISRAALAITFLFAVRLSIRHRIYMCRRLLRRQAAVSPRRLILCLKTGSHCCFSVLLFLNISVYAVTILTLNILVLIIRPEIFFGFDGIYRLLILFGFFTQTAIVTFFIIVIKFERLVEWACSLVISILCKIRLCKKSRKSREKN